MNAWIPIREKEIINTISKLKLGNPLDHDEITAEIVNFMETHIFEVINDILKTKSILKDWNTISIIPIYKKMT